MAVEEEEGGSSGKWTGYFVEIASAEPTSQRLLAGSRGAGDKERTK